MDRRIAILLRKFLTGKSNTTEQADLDNWFGKNKHRNEVGDSLQEWPIVKVRMWNHIQKEIKPAQRTPIIPLVFLRTAIAASVLLTIGVSMAILYLGGNKQRNTQVAANQTVITSGVGEVKQITLADGSRVWLNAKTTIRYSDDYGKKIRKIELSGEAFFDVARDTTKPFLVYTRHSITRVLGTSFSIHAYPNETQSVGVARGKVGVSITDAPGLGYCKLVPGDQVSFNLLTKKVEHTHIDTARLMYWKNNVLYFDSMPLNEVAATLERKFGVRIQIVDPGLTNRQFKGTFYNKSLTHILHSIGLSMGLTIKEIDGTLFEISGN